MNTATHKTNADPGELQHFAALAQQWWDAKGPMGPLHEINPLRLSFIQRFESLDGLKALDVGCGGGILSEALARAGAHTCAIDLAHESVEVARQHAAEQGLEVEYLEISAEDLAEQREAQFDVITCMEMLEHVPDPQSVIAACTRLLKPGGRLYLSTINRNPKAFALAIVGAEHVLGLIPKGTHEYAKFIKPSELAGWCRQCGLHSGPTEGMTYNPLTRTHRLSRDVSVNYLMRAIKPA